MTERDLDQPRMIYTGTLPAHFAPADDALDDDVLEPAEDTPGSIAPVAIVAAAALAIGVAIGVFIPPLFHGRSSPVSAAQPPAALAAPAAPVAAAQVPAPEAAPALASASATPKPVAGKPAKSARPRVAVALLSPGRAPRAARKAKDADLCPFKGSRADQVTCSNPEIAVAAREMEAAYWRAVGAKAPAEALRSNEVEWRLAREQAASRSPADLAKAYRVRTAQLEFMADEPPH